MWLRYILISFFLCGISDTTWKMAGEVAKDSVNSYLLIFHISALLAAITAVKLKKNKISRLEFSLGWVIGFLLIAGGICSLKAIVQLPGIVFFPVASSASLLLVTILAHIIWKEKPDLRQIFGLLIACASILLIALE